MEDYRVENDAPRKQSVAEDEVSAFAGGLIDNIFSTVVNSIKTGDLKINKLHTDWNPSPTNKARIEKIKTLKNYDRITRLLHVNYERSPEKILLKNMEKISEEKIYVGTNAEDILQSDLDQLKKAQSLNKWLKEMKVDNNDRKRRIKEFEEMKMAQLREELQKQEEQRRQYEMDQERQKEERQMERVQRMQQRQEEKRKELELMQIAKDRVSKRLNTPPLHLKMEKNFEATYTVPQLEKRKQQLNEIRNSMKALNPEELKEHERLYMEAHKEQMKRIEASKGMQANVDVDPNLYRGVNAQRVAKEMKEHKARLVEEKEEAKRKAEAIAKYDEIVKKKYMPSIDHSKRNEVELRKEKKKVQTVYDDSDLMRKHRAEANAFIKASTTLAASDSDGSLGKKAAPKAKKPKAEPSQPVVDETTRASDPLRNGGHPPPNKNKKKKKNTEQLMSAAEQAEQRAKELAQNGDTHDASLAELEAIRAKLQILG